MKRLTTVLFFCFLLGATFSAKAGAASFDCGKAGTRVEKLICTNRLASEYDGALAEAYQSAMHDPDESKKSQLVADQRKWLASVRNQCADAACLVAAYTDRLAALRTLSGDEHPDLTCERMRKFPDVFFVDQVEMTLGASRVPITKVDHDCPEGLSQLPYLRRLTVLAETIRAENTVPGPCTGTIMFASQETYDYALTKAGFMPSQLVAGDDAANVLHYFQQWSWESPYNADLYKNFMTEFNKAMPLLAERYQQQFGYPAQEANAKARTALMIITSRAAGTLDKESIKAEGPLIALLRNAHSSLADLTAALAQSAGHDDAKIGAYAALKVALYQNKPAPWIATLLTFIGPIDDKALQAGDESALFAALHKRDAVRVLLNSGEQVDYTNSFGKTALFYAIGYGDRELVNMLLAHGANVNHPYFSAHQLNPDDDECHFAMGRVLTHTKRTPLMHAAQNSDVDMMKLLVSHGARIHDLDESGDSALDYAVMGNSAANQAYLGALGVRPGTPRHPVEHSNRADAARPAP